MKARYLIAITALGAVFAMPVAAHHNCAAGDEYCPVEIGDELGMHEAAIEGLSDTSTMTSAMDPVDAVGTSTWDGDDPTQSGQMED